MGLRHAILGILTADGLTGYEFTKAFEDSVGYVWSAPQSQIYPELRRMEADGLVVGEDLARGSSTKRRYTITDEGRAELQAWLEKPVPFRAERNPHRLQALYYDMIAPEVAHEHFEAHLHHWEERRAQWQTRRQTIVARRLPLLRRRLEHRDPAEHEAITAFKAHAFEGQIAVAEAEIAWAKRGLELIDELAK